MVQWKKFEIAMCIVNIKEWLQELKSWTLKSCWKELWPGLTVGDDEGSMQIETLAEDIA